jgi:hypothetical protein
LPEVLERVGRKIVELGGRCGGVLGDERAIELSLGRPATLAAAAFDFAA